MVKQIWSLFINVIILLCMVSGIGFCEKLDSPNLTASERWWAPTVFSSVDAAVATLRNNLNQYCQWNGASARQQIDVDAYGIRLTGFIEGTNTTYQYVPNTGGYWVGGKYVPYTGGSTQPVHKPYSEQHTVSIPYKTIKTMDLLYFPNLDRDYKWGLRINYDDGKSTTLRGATLDIMSQVGDALATLVLSSGKLLPTPVGAYFYASSGADEQSLRKKLNWNEDSGAVILSVITGNSPIASAGLQQNDIILKVNGIEIKSGEHWFQVLRASLENKDAVKLNLDVYRNGQVLAKEMTVPNFSAGRSKLFTPSPPNAALKQPPSLGLEVRALSEEEAAAVEFPSGMMVVKVAEGGIAHKSGVKAYDVLLEINGRTVKDITQLKAIVSSEPISKIKVFRDGAVVVLEAVNSI
jgi:hypothetical protein